MSETPKSPAQLMNDLTDQVRLLRQDVVNLTATATTKKEAAALRASERFLWPLAYALLVAAVAALAHGMGGRRAGQVLAALAVDVRPEQRIDRLGVDDAVDGGEHALAHGRDQPAQRLGGFDGGPELGDGIARRPDLAEPALDAAARADPDASIT